MRMSPLELTLRSMQQAQVAIGGRSEVRILAWERGGPVERLSLDKPCHR